MTESDRLVFTADQRALIRENCCAGASDSEVEMLIEVASLRRLNPLTRQIHFVERWASGRKVWSCQVSIDGLRIIAQRTGLYDGQDEPEPEYDAQGNLALYRVRVYRKDWGRPAVGVARWDEYVQRNKDGKPTRFWANMSHVMLAKCAESLALRKAFPEDMGGLYTPEEMSQAANQPEVDDTFRQRTPASNHQPEANPEWFDELVERAKSASTVEDIDKIRQSTRAVRERLTTEQMLEITAFVNSAKSRIAAAEDAA